VQKLLDSPTIFFVIIGIVIFLIGLFILIIGFIGLLKSASQISSRLEHYVGEKKSLSGSALLKRIIPREISGSAISRIFTGLTQKILALATQLTPEKQMAKLDHDLALAGNPANLKAGGFFGLQFLLFIVGVLIALWILITQQPLQYTSIIGSILIFILCLLLPKAWLNGRVRAVQDEIRRGLPDALDMLSVCASAGLGFDQSLQKISQYWQSTLGDELKRTIHEMEMGITRSTALRNMADRLSVDDLSRFIAIIIQAETMGMSYAEVLHSQAAQMRILRQFRAKEIANRLPAKMIIPLGLFIFPALIAVILGPVIPTLLNLFG
jgi:tight adherence protein C